MTGDGTMVGQAFLDDATHLCKWICLLVGWSILPSPNFATNTTTRMTTRPLFGLLRSKYISTTYTLIHTMVYGRGSLYKSPSISIRGFVCQSVGPWVLRFCYIAKMINDWLILGPWRLSPRKIPPQPLHSHTCTWLLSNMDASLVACRPCFISKQNYYWGGYGHCGWIRQTVIF